ncbi:MAG: sporulation integral membrane protein YlbJ [Bacillota bacterium]|jgi:sporulation integral membrane protein YlbJ
MKKLLLPFSIFFILCMLIFPQQSYDAARDGLIIWWEIVLPALLPFFIGAELLLASNAVEYMGYLLAPIMRPVFRLPGEAALALVMGYSSGFPTGAAITASLREKGLVDREEGERLIAFTNNASPLFITISVAAGILAEPQLGYFLMSIHYGSNLLIGFFLRFFSPKKTVYYRKKNLPPQKQNSLPMGKLLKNAAQKAGGNVAIIGCYLVFFSVFTQLIETSGITGLVIKLFNLNYDIFQPLSLGVWEMTLGINAIGDNMINLSIKVAICAALLAWGGFSVQAQVAAMVSDTDIRTRIYFISRFFQVVVSFILAVMLWDHWPLIKSVISIDTDILLSTAPIMIFILPMIFLVIASLIGRMLIVIRNRN